MNSSDSAEEIVKLSLDGMEFALKIAGKGAMNVAVMLYNIAKDREKTKGKARLSNMLKSGKALKIFTIKAEDLKKFYQEAKKYGVLYCVLADKKNEKIDGIVDILVREEDAAKINRITERFNFAKVDVEIIEQQLEQEKEQDKTEQKTADENITEELSNQTEKSPSNNIEKTELENQLENSLDTKLEDKQIPDNIKKKSVREELITIEQEIKQKDIEPKMQSNKTKKKQSKRYKDGKKKPKHLKEPKHLETQKRKKTKAKER